MEVPVTAWQLPDPAAAPPSQELLGVGADLAPATMLAAYQRGLFPMQIDGQLGWWSPEPRCVIPLDRLVVTRSLRKSMRRFHFTYDEAFGDVVAGCADASRPHGWITAAFIDAYRRLFELGWAHSVEAWIPPTQPDAPARLAGGIFGIEIGGLFAAESMFHSVTDGSKAALVALVDVLAAGQRAPDRILDAQWMTAHLASVGAIDCPRADYLAALPAALALASAFPPQPASLAPEQAATGGNLAR